MWPRPALLYDRETSSAKSTPSLYIADAGSTSITMAPILDCASSGAKPWNALLTLPTKAQQGKQNEWLPIASEMTSRTTTGCNTHLNRATRLPTPNRKIAMMIVKQPSRRQSNTTKNKPRDTKRGGTSCNRRLGRMRYATTDERCLNIGGRLQSLAHSHHTCQGHSLPTASNRPNNEHTTH